MSTYWLHTDSYFHPRVCWFYFGILLLAQNISSSVHHTSVPATHSPAGGFKIGAPSLEWAAFWMHQQLVDQWQVFQSGEFRSHSHL